MHGETKVGGGVRCKNMYIVHVSVSLVFNQPNETAHLVVSPKSEFIWYSLQFNSNSVWFICLTNLFGRLIIQIFHTVVLFSLNVKRLAALS
jgi:hypothetical protein